MRREGDLKSWRHLARAAGISFMEVLPDHFGHSVSDVVHDFQAEDLHGPLPPANTIQQAVEHADVSRQDARVLLEDLFVHVDEVVETVSRGPSRVPH